MELARRVIGRSHELDTDFVAAAESLDLGNVLERGLRRRLAPIARRESAAPETDEAGVVTSRPQGLFEPVVPVADGFNHRSFQLRKIGPSPLTRSEERRVGKGCRTIG